MKQLFLEAGKIRNTHALRGEVKMECWLDGENPFGGVRAFYLSAKGEGELKVKSVRRQGELFLVLFEGYDSVEKAALLKGRTVFAARKELDPDDTKIYFADLIGLPLIEEKTGLEYGKIKEVSTRGGGELFTVLLPDGREAYFPVVKEWMIKMDAEEGVFVHAPEGIFD